MQKQSLSINGLAKLAGLTARRIGQLVSEGIISPQSRGEYDLETCVRRLIDYYRARHVPGDAKAERIRILQAERRLKEMEVDEKETQVVRTDLVTTLIGSFVNLVRTEIDNLEVEGVDDEQRFKLETAVCQAWRVACTGQRISKKEM